MPVEYLNEAHKSSIMAAMLVNHPPARVHEEAIQQRVSMCLGASVLATARVAEASEWRGVPPPHTRLT